MSRWALIDYENLGTLEKVPLERYERVIVFRGPKNPAIKFGPALGDSRVSLEIIALSSSGRNNLDFHLALYLGRYHETAPENVEFHVISGDNGFAGLVEHLNGLGRQAKQVSLLTDALLKKKPKETAPTPPPLSPGGQAAITVLRSLENAKRPKKKDKLVNFITSHTRNLEPPAKAGKIYQELVRAKLITEEPSEKIDYMLPS